jgi:hypothetical protein
MLSLNTLIYKETKDGDINEVLNPIYGKPYPAYQAGFTLFAASFNPTQKTVFGIGKQTTSVYNTDILVDMLEYMSITRTFKEVTGRDGFKMHQELVKFTTPEAETYKIYLNRFREVWERHYISTGSTRKDSGLMAIRQLNLLIKACWAFHMMPEYTANTMSSKHKAVIAKVKALSGEYVAIGCLTKESVKLYAEEIAKACPDRNILSFTGEDLDVYGRITAIEDIKTKPGTVLITTQQSLSCSLNIGFVDHIILPELQYNDSRMGQYYFRFIRYDCNKDKDIYIISYEGSIETNLMQLIIEKEKLNRLAKNDACTDEELNEKYGIDYDIQSLLHSKETDENGKLWVTWGNQSIVNSRQLTRT